MELGGPEILIVLVVVVLLFGGSKLPKLARSLGSAKGEFERGMREGSQAAAADDGDGANDATDDDPSASRAPEGSSTGADRTSPSPAPPEL